MARGDFPELVERLRSGPPLWSPFRLKAVDRLLNGMEYFIHHEDVRRAQPGWQPRDLPPAVQDTLWRGLRSAARGLLRHAPVGVVATRSDTGETTTLKTGPDPVTVTGPPAELALFVFDRKQHAHVDLHGSPDAVARLTHTPLGI
jgi:uncharacterized protein (TIGR03085 family)